MFHLEFDISGDKRFRDAKKENITVNELYFQAFRHKWNAIQYEFHSCSCVYGDILMFSLILVSESIHVNQSSVNLLLVIIKGLHPPRSPSCGLFLIMHSL